MFNVEIGIDLGTANTLFYTKEKGIIFNEPSVVAIDTESGNVLAAGIEAKEMIGKTPEKIIAIRPLKEGVIADYDLTTELLKHIMRKASKSVGFAIRKPNVVICTPSGSTSVERRAIQDAVRNAGAKKIYMIVTYPPVRYPCYAGIDFPSMDELLANQFTIKEGEEIEVNSKVSKLIGADEVFYNDTTNLAKAIGIHEEELCFTCSTGNYSPLGITPKFRTRREIKGEDN